MKIPELLKITIEGTKKCARLGDSPMAYFEKDGKTAITVLAISSKDAIKVALYRLVKSLDLKEIIFTNEAFYLEHSKENYKGKNIKDIKLETPIRNNPKRKECFIITYFSKDKCMTQMLPFHRKKGTSKDILVWDKEGKISEESQSLFNPFDMTEKDVKRYAESVQIDMIKEKGVKETKKCTFGYKMDIYRLNGKAMFELVRPNGEVSLRSKPIDDDKKFKETMNEAVSIMEGIAKVMIKNMEDKND